MAKIRGIKPEFWTDENVVELSIAARLLFIGLWTYACDNGHLQDKSKQIKMRVLPTEDVNCAELLREIEAQGLITRADGWITVPNLLQHQKVHKRWFAVCDKPGCVFPEGYSYGYQKADSQPASTVEQPLNNGGDNGEPTVEQPLNNGGSTADVDGDVDVDGDLMLMVNNESDADGADAPKTLALVEATPRADVVRLCVHLADRIESNGAKRPSVGKTWHDAARLMLDSDKRSEDEVHRAIDWCQDDEFWRANVLSMPKLREKYDQLRLQASRRPGGGRAAETSALLERAMARAEARERGGA